MRLSEGLLVAHVCVLASFLVGASAFQVADAVNLSRPRAMLHVICTCATGFALLGVALFILAIARFLSPLFIILALLGIVAISWAVRRDAPFSRAYWAIRLGLLVRCWDLPALTLYYVLLLISVPCVIPNLGGDPVAYHLAYPWEWAQYGGLMIDPFLREPFYASNYNLFFAVLFSFHAGAFVNFLTWAAAFLTGFGILSAVRVALPEEPRTFPWMLVTGVALTFAVLLNPVFLRWLPTAYIDIPIGAFALMTLLCLFLAIFERKSSWLWNVAVVGGFWIGMKPSFLILLPVIVVLITMAARSIRVRGRMVVLAIGLVCICASPWYIRNVIVAGDPVPPVLNLAVYGKDGIISKAEWQLIEHDRDTSRTANSFALLPVRSFFMARTKDFRDYGTSALMLLLYFPALVWFVLFCSGRPKHRVFSIATLLLTLLALYWFATGTYLRYSLLFYPILAVSVALAYASLLPETTRKNAPAWLSAAAAFVALGATIATPGIEPFFNNYYLTYFKFLPSDFVSDDDYLRRFGNGYAEEEFASHVLLKNGIHGRIYVFGDNAMYYFRVHGITSMGDWVGPAGYFRLAAAIDARQSLQYLRGLGVQAVMMEPSGRASGLAVPLERQLLRGGYCPVIVRGTKIRLLVQYASCHKLVSVLEEVPRTFARSS